MQLGAPADEEVDDTLAYDNVTNLFTVSVI